MNQRDMPDERHSLARRFAHVALPHPVLDCSPWEGDDGAWSRLFTVQEWTVGAVVVAVAGQQAHTGEVTHWVYIGGEEQLSAAELVRLEDALADARRLLASLR